MQERIERYRQQLEESRIRREMENITKAVAYANKKLSKRMRNLRRRARKQQANWSIATRQRPISGNLEQRFARLSLIEREEEINNWQELIPTSEEQFEIFKLYIEQWYIQNNLEAEHERRRELIYSDNKERFTQDLQPLTTTASRATMLLAPQQQQSGASNGNGDNGNGGANDPLLEEADNIPWDDCEFDHNDMTIPL